MIVSPALGLLLVRVAFGLAFGAHGSQKLFGWFGGKGIAATGGMFDALGFRPGRLFATVAATSEVLAGILIVTGLFGAVGPMLVMSTMTVAVVAIHWRNGFFQANNGIELAYIYAVAAAAIAFAGYGTWSLDTAFGITATSGPGVALALLALGILGGLATVVQSRLQAKAAPVAS
jgi:putative oxidoreductase